jgi:hypothetical protein
VVVVERLILEEIRKLEVLVDLVVVELLEIPQQVPVEQEMHHQHHHRKEILVELHISTQTFGEMVVVEVAPTPLVVMHQQLLEETVEMDQHHLFLEHQ